MNALTDAKRNVFVGGVRLEKTWSKGGNKENPDQKISESDERFQLLSRDLRIWISTPWGEWRAKNTAEYREDKQNGENTEKQSSSSSSSTKMGKRYLFSLDGLFAKLGQNKGKIKYGYKNNYKFF